jgi:cell division protein FtsZ
MEKKMEKNLRLTFPKSNPESQRIKVIGVGGGGGNIVNTMIKKGIDGTDFMAVNTDRQALGSSQSRRKIQIGKILTRGFGSGGDPYLGRKAIEENYEDVRESLKNTDVLFITCGMGGGTGTGASPVIAKIAKELGSFAVGVVASPFDWEGSVRGNQAKEGIRRLRRVADAVIVVSNQKLPSLVDDSVSFIDGFEVANKMIFQIIRGIAEIINRPGFVNVDFADVRTIISEPGDTFVGIGQGTGKGRASKAVRKAMESGLLGDKSIRNAVGVLVNLTGDSNFTFQETDEAMRIVHEVVPEDANLIFGGYIDETLHDEVRIILVATGIGQDGWRTSSGVIAREQNLNIPAFKRTRRTYVDDEDVERSEDLGIPAFIRRQNERSS